MSREINPPTVQVRMEVETGEVKEHPTYKRIQEYVQERYGFKVHTAYIAEVKRMVGLDNGREHFRQKSAKTVKKG